MAVLLLSADLSCISRLTGAARHNGVPVEAAMSPAVLQDKLSAQEHALLLIDLTLPGLEVEQLMAQMDRNGHRPKKVVAFGPHVQEARLQSAQAAGCDLVLARGQFYAQLEQILSLARSPG